ncbi:hypothetical protein BC941DRAFT_435343 [Chlamydoabsidia padenii]|nr:hypothetical protein BC941DRAFT_435343 [Chlamydoabsidia padenii]
MNSENLQIWHKDHYQNQNQMYPFDDSNHLYDLASTIASPSLSCLFDELSMHTTPSTVFGTPQSVDSSPHQQMSSDYGTPWTLPLFPGSGDWSVPSEMLISPLPATGLSKQASSGFEKSRSTDPHWMSPEINSKETLTSYLMHDLPDIMGIPGHLFKDKTTCSSSTTIDDSSATQKCPARRFKCPDCCVSYSRRQDRNRHVLSKHKKANLFYCNQPGCSKGFRRSDVCKKHFRTVHRIPSDFHKQTSFCHPSL